MASQYHSDGYLPVPASDDASGVAAITRELLTPGFFSLHEALEIVGERAEDEGHLPPVQVEVIVKATWAAMMAEQLTWPDEGDYTKLRSAFDELETNGFAARMNFTCCQNCGHDEMDDERVGTERAYVFFHQQDSERLGAPESPLYLAFGFFSGNPAFPPALLKAAADGDEQARQQRREIGDRVQASVGEQLVATLRSHGLQVRWDGSHKSRPVVMAGNWRKKLPTG